MGKSYTYNKSTGEPLDYTVTQANERILSRNIEFYKNYFKDLVIGELTLRDAVMAEIDIHKNKKEYCMSLNFGNSVRLANHCIKTLQQFIRESETKKTMISYIWETNPDKKLPELYSLMTNTYKLIAPETTYDQFKAVFKGQDTKTINPIKWHDDNISELIYFDKVICQVLYPKTKRANYKRMAACFIKPDGQPFEANFKEISYGVEINLSKEKQNNIDLLIKSILKP